MSRQCNMGPADLPALRDRCPSHPEIAKGWARSKVCWTLSAKGYRIPIRVFNEDGPRRPIVVVHGLQSHSAWFTQSSSYMGDLGYPVYAFDRKGSGLSDQPRGDMEDHRDLIHEIQKVVEFATHGRSEPQVHVLAHCFGAIPVVLFASRSSHRIRSLVLATPGIYTHLHMSVHSVLLTLWSWLAPCSVSIPVPYPVEELTDQPDYLDFIRSDPLAISSINGRFLINALCARLALTRCNLRLRMPVLLALAGRDRLVDNAKTKAFLEKTAGPCIETRIYGHAKHILEFSPDRDAFLDDLQQWLGQTDGSPDT